MKFRYIWFRLSLTFILLSAFFQVFAQNKHCIVIHGGAGVMDQGKMPESRQKEYLLHLEKALMKGDSVLRNGGTSMDAVITAFVYLEDCPLFNAGKGAVFTWEGNIELDASVMDGSTMKAGAIASVRKTRNPVRLARLVMEKSPHVLLGGKGADKFAREQGVEMVAKRYFFTRERYNALKKMKREEINKEVQDKSGTVGCVALDRFGNLSSGTSTGGMTGKRYGRIGDTPLIGAGTYANNNCAVSCTGHGEYFIGLGIAMDVASRMEYLGEPLDKAAGAVLDKLTRAGGTGGLIALDRNGNIAMPFNTPGMFRGYLKSTGEKEIAIFAP